MSPTPPELALFARQRAHRSFGSAPLDDAAVEQVLEAATRAPSAQNLQPWEFVVVRDGDRRRAVWALAERLWTGGARDLAAAGTDPRLHADVDRGLLGGCATAPVTIVVGAHRDRTPPGSLGSSVYPAVQNLLLAATALGLASALTTIATYATDELRTLVDLPPEVDPIAVIPLGHPARPLGPNRRDPVAGHTHRERWGRPW